MANTIKYQEAWEPTLQERLRIPTNWKDICDVIYTDTSVYEFPFVGTASESALQTGLTRGNTYTFQDITMSTETLSIQTFDILPELLDRADEAQSTYAKRVDRARLQGDKINERLERIMQTLFAGATNLGDNGSGGISLTATQLAVSGTNIDDVVRAIIEQIHVAKGTKQYLANGGFAEWRPSDWTFLTAFMQANGYVFADEALNTGNKGLMGKESMGLYHYLTDSNANHIACGVRKIAKLGILNATYGKVYIVEDPAGSTGGNISGISVNSRLDYGTLLPAVAKTLTFDFNTTV